MSEMSSKDYPYALAAPRPVVSPPPAVAAAKQEAATPATATRVALDRQESSSEVGRKERGGRREYVPDEHISSRYF